MKDCPKGYESFGCNEKELMSGGGLLDEWNIH